MMDFEEIIEEKKPIYGKWAILSFCVFFSPIFGGFMLRQNLKEKGEVKMGWAILFLSFGLACITAALATTPFRGPGTTFVANLLEGAFLVEFVFKKHFPNEEAYPKKSVTKPLAISFFVVTLALLLVAASGVPLPTQ